jgi:hypothetical protein
MADASAKGLLEETSRIEHLQHSGEVDRAEANAPAVPLLQEGVLPIAIRPDRMNSESGSLRSRSEPRGPGLLDELGVEWPLGPRHTLRLEPMLFLHDDVVTLAPPCPHGICAK